MQYFIEVELPLKIESKALSHWTVYMTLLPSFLIYLKSSLHKTIATEMTKYEST